LSKHKNLVSIIIPSYNSLKFLNESIHSALNQTYDKIEIILIDDGSTDGTKNHFHIWEKQGVRCINQENTGASSARNHGLSFASGEYIQFLDADDVLHKDKIITQVEAMKINNADLSFTGWGNFKENPQISQRFKFRDKDFTKIKTGIDVFKSFGNENWYIPTLSWLTKRELITKAGYWNPSFCPNDDGEFFSRVIFWSQNVMPIKEKLAYYRVSVNESLSKLNSADKIRASIISWEQITSLLKSLNDEDVLYYPKRNYHYLFKAISKRNPNLAKIIKKNFEDIEVEFIGGSSSYNYLINRFGLSTGFFLFKIGRKLKNYKSLIKEKACFFKQ
jgi:glycosyltransferase involved in cell wall biosynthesis